MSPLIKLQPDLKTITQIDLYATGQRFAAFTVAFTGFFGFFSGNGCALTGS